MPCRRTILISLVAFTATVCGMVLATLPGSQVSRAELAVRDVFARCGWSVPANPKLIFLAIDTASISLDGKADLATLFDIESDKTPEARALGLMSRSWPWPREVYALVLDRLFAAGAKAVGFDLLFPTATDGDAAFRAALERYRGKVVVGSNFISSPDGVDHLDAALTLPSSTLIPQSRTPDDRVGFVNFWPDPDGAIRNARFQMNFAEFLPGGASMGEPDHSSLAAQLVRKAGYGNMVPHDSLSHTFRFTGPSGHGFRPRSIFEIFVPRYWERNFGNGAAFKDAIVIIGAAGNWQHDEHPTPYGVTAGPEIQLHVVNALLQHVFLRPVPWGWSLAIWIAFGVASAMCAIRLVSPVRQVACMLAIGGVWLCAQLPLFRQPGVLMTFPIAGPLLVLAAVGLFSIVHDRFRAGAEQFRLRVALAERKRNEEALERANTELETRVAARTTELVEANSSLKRLLEEKTVLLKEVHHRVKNNLQIISSLLNLQSGSIQDPVALKCFNESRNRVRSMALIHEKLYQSNDLAQIDFEDYLKTLTTGLQSSFAGSARGVQMSVEVDAVMLGVDSAVPCGLIVNELVTNCFKYAFKDRPGEIRVGLKRAPGSRLQLTVSDDGVGFPKGIDLRNTESLGMQIVTTLADQLEGSIELRNGVGTTFEISFPEIQAIQS